MPNKPRRYNRIRSASRRALPHRRVRADSVKELLGRPSAVLDSIADQAARQRVWRAWLDERLPADLRARVSGVVAREGELVIFAVSAGWSVRLRYALADLEAELRGVDRAIERIVVRVMPNGTSV
ncbi:MAG TPA: DciA family protein [Steroidobacteraceae bacterium]|nr:DciA family protein [Steroidobacteraceae bacterium]